MATQVTASTTATILNSTTANQVGDGFTRGTFSRHLIQVICTGTDVTVHIQISADGIHWVDTGVTLVGNTGELLDGVYPFIRASRDNTTNPVQVIIFSSGAFDVNASPAIFQQGTFAIPNATQDFAVTFTSDFAVIPEVIIPVIQNTSADPTKLALQAAVVGKTVSGFNIHLSANTNTAHYELHWVAGYAGLLFQVVASAGKKLSEYPELAGADLLDTDYLMATHTASFLETMRLRISSIKALFPKLISAIPTSPAASGLAGQIVISPKYIYTHNGVLWGQTDRRTTGWLSE